MRVAALLCLLAGLASAERPPVGSTATIDRPVALVYREPIWVSELDEHVRSAALVAAIKEPTPDLVGKVLDQMIADAVTAHVADGLHLMVTEQEIDAAIDQVKLENKLDDGALDKALADVHMTRTAYREELRKQIRTTKLVQLQIGPKIFVTDDEVAREYAKQKADKPDLGKLDDAMRESLRKTLREHKLETTYNLWMRDQMRAAHVVRRM